MARLVLLIVSSKISSVRSSLCLYVYLWGRLYTLEMRFHQTVSYLNVRFGMRPIFKLKGSLARALLSTSL